MDMSLRKLWEIANDGEAWCPAVQSLVSQSQITEQLKNKNNNDNFPTNDLFLFQDPI